jgi:hypothetical protein
MSRTREAMIASLIVGMNDDRPSVGFTSSSESTVMFQEGVRMTASCVPVYDATDTEGLGS